MLQGLFSLRRAATLLTNPTRGKIPLGLISKRPYIFLSSLYLSIEYSLGLLHPLAFALSNFSVTFMFICTWQMTVESASKLKKWIELFNKKFPTHRIIVLANSVDEQAVLDSLEINCILCNHNCFIDEAIFRPMNCDKVYDAVYDARLSPYKRVELASEVERLAIISYTGSGWKDREYGTRLIDLMHNVDWVNRESEFGFKWMDPVDVNGILNKSRVGLCLSQVEGAMYASIQYLLAGLPIVTTYNAGGRDLFFDNEYVRWVDADPNAVSRAVDELAKKNIDSVSIRTSVMKRVWEHRTRFIDLVQSIYGEHACNRIYRDEWSAKFFNKMQDGQLRWWHLI